MSTPEPNIQLAVVLKAVPGGEPLPGDAYTRHLTPGGMFVVTPAKLEQGTEVDAEIRFPGHDEPLCYRAVVVWSREPIPRPETARGVGVKFLFQNDTEKLALIDFLRPTLHESGGLPNFDRPYRILVAEDNQHIRGMYLYGISRLARLELPSEDMIEVTEVADGGEAERTILGASFDMLIFDLFMPHVRGDDLIKRLRKDPRYRSVPVLVISAGGDEGRERALAAGADFYLEKPIVLNDLIGAVKMLLFIERPRRLEP